MRRIVITLFMLGACRPKAAPSVAVDASVVDAAAPDAEAPKAPLGPPFALVMRLPPNTRPSIDPLSDGIALTEFKDATVGVTWRVSTIVAGQKPVVVVPKWSTVNDSMVGDQIWGRSDLVFLGLEADRVIRGTPKGATKLPKHYRHFVEVRDGQWLGLNGDGAYSADADADPVHYDLMAGKGAVLPIPRDVHPRNGTVVRLSPGRICADVTFYDDNGPHQAIWTGDIEGHENVALDERDHHVFRGADGECWSTFGEYAVARVNGDDLGPLIAVDIRTSGSWGVRPDHDGGLWFVEVSSFIPTRTTIQDGKAVNTPYPLPEQVEGCSKPRAMEVAAVSANDVWALGVCDGKDADYVLFHTAP